MERTDPPLIAAERETLAAFLDYFRATVLRKASGVTEEQARWSPVPSGTSLFGLVAHLTIVERYWFRAVMAGEDVVLPWDDDDPDADPDVDWKGPEGATLADVMAAYEEECARSRAILAAHDLDAVVRAPDRGDRTVRWIAVHMVEETARHVGHADFLRELVDGAVGD